MVELCNVMMLSRVSLSVAISLLVAGKGWISDVGSTIAIVGGMGG